MESFHMQENNQEVYDVTLTLDFKQKVDKRDRDKWLSRQETGDQSTTE